MAKKNFESQTTQHRSASPAKKTPSPSASSVDTQLVRDLAEILKETDLSEIEVKHGSAHIRVSRHQNTYPLKAPALTMPNYAINMPEPIRTSGITPQKVEAEKPKEDISGKPVPSPMVGTAYLAPAPGATPFVTVGQTVKQGDTLLIIEAMKTMNHIAAPEAGTIKAILVQDAQPIEFGEALVIIG